MTMVGKGLMPFINIKETSQATQINHNKIFRSRRLGRLLNMLYYYVQLEIVICSDGGIVVAYLADVADE